MPGTDFDPPDLTVLAAVFAAGVGLLLGGAANLLLGRTRAWVRVAVTAGACAAAAAGAWAVAESAAAAAAAGGVATVGLILAAPRRPVARWAGVAAAGMALAAGALVWHGAADDAALERSEEELALINARPHTRPAAIPLSTDRGTAVVVWEATDPRTRAEIAALEARIAAAPAGSRRAMRSQPADDRANCHGWVFTGGRYWISGVGVEAILAENGYRPVADPRPGDVAVYRQGGAVVHSALVRYVTPGRPVLVEGKSGAGGVNLHAAGDSEYGSAFTYYRTDRATHLLAGLDSPDAAPAPAGGQ